MKKIKIRGFTMIELLIVMAILGILAVAVLSAINPLEQIRRGRDTGSRSDCEQLVNAVERHYASHGYFPWQTSEADTSSFTWADSTSGNTAFADMLGDLITAEEVRSGYTSRITKSTANAIFFYYDGSSTGNSPYACFLPQSNSFKVDAAADCKQRTAATDFPKGSACAGNCTSGTWTSGLNCYLCLP